MKPIFTFITVLLITMAAAHAELGISISDLSGNTTQGTTLNSSFHLINTGEQANVSFSSTDLTGPATIAASEVSFNPASISDLAHLGETDITVEVPTVSNQATGTYTGTITATALNSTHNTTATASITFTVADANQIPYFTSTPTTTALTGQTYSYQATAQDDDGDSLTYSLVNGPLGLSVSSAGLVTWAPTSSGSNAVNISVSDGTAIAYQSWTIVVSVPGGTISFSDLTMGDDNQERDKTITGTFTISNEGVAPINALEISTTASSEYNTQFTIPTTTIGAGQSLDIGVELYIPDDQDAGVSKIGTITAKASAGGTTVTETHDLNVEVANHLLFKDVDITIDGRKRNVDDGDDFDIKPGDEVEVKVKVENDFSESIDIEDVEVVIENNDLDWDETEDISRIRDDDDDTVTFSFTVPIDASESDSPFQIDLQVDGQDENGANHGESWTFELNLDKERDELTIDYVELNPSTILCQSNTVLSVSIVNTGRDDQSNGVLRVSNDELDFDSIMRDLELDEGDEITRDFSISIPNNIKSGSYPFDVRVYTSSRDSDLTDVGAVVLSVLGCDSTSSDDNDDTSDTTSNDNTIIIPPTTTPGPTGQIIQTTTGTPKKSSLNNDTLYLIGLIIVIVLLIILIIIVGMKAFK